MKAVNTKDGENVRQKESPPGDKQKVHLKHICYSKKERSPTKSSQRS